MGRKYLTRISILAVLSMLPLSAHQIWIEKSGNGYELAYGENVNDRDPLTFSKVKCFKGITKNGFNDELHVFNTPSGDDPEAGEVTVNPFDNYSVIVAGMSNGYYIAVEDASAERGYTYLKDPVYGNIDANDKNIVKTFKSIKFAKHIVKWNKSSKKPVGQRLEIIPLKNVSKLHQGDTLKFKILYEGKPVRGNNTSIYKSSDPNLASEENPKMPITGSSCQTTTIGAPGLQTVVVKHKVMLNKEGTKYISIAAALSFYTE